MRREEGKFILATVAVLVAVFLIEGIRPEPLDWTPNYWRNDSRPYGSQVLFDLLEAQVGMPVEVTEVPPYELLTEKDMPLTTFVIITEELAMSEEAATRLLKFVERGHTLFVAAGSFEGGLRDTLGLATRVDLFFDEAGLDSLLAATPLLPGQQGINLDYEGFHRDEGYRFKEDQVQRYFYEPALLEGATRLGSSPAGHPNFIRIPHGAGNIFVSSVPRVFTNYSMLTDGGDAYVAAALSYLPQRRVWWDAYTKPMRQTANTPLRYVLSQRSLKAGYWVAVMAVFLMLIFQTRRRQRLIPVIEPEQNTTLDFVETVGRLYFQHGNHANLAKKMADHWLDYVRTTLNLPTAQQDDVLWRRISERAGVPEAQVAELGKWVELMQQDVSLSEAKLHAFSKLLEDFYARSVR